MATRIEAPVEAESDRYSAVVIAEPFAYVEGGERVLRVELEIGPKQKGQEQGGVSDFRASQADRGCTRDRPG